MSQVSLTPSQENYLEWIHRLSADGPVQVSALASELGVQLPSVSRAVRGLAELGLVDHKSYGSIRLTDRGEAVAAEIMRRDKCLTALLVEVLGVPAEQAAKEVHRLEHVISDDVLRRLETLVDFALSSDAWVRRLQLRIGTADARTHQASDHGVVVGASRIHAGDERES
ncbi:hypothetical protein GF377_01410 [candidate division GN15 bacterium]|nr:hypothetical protein [candidate division GN15 bacterium]